MKHSAIIAATLLILIFGIIVFLQKMTLPKDDPSHPDYSLCNYLFEAFGPNDQQYKDGCM